MIEIDGLAEVVLNVRSLEQAVEFYEGLLGLTRLSPSGLPGPVFLCAGAATSRVPAMIVLVPLPPDAATFSHPRTLHHLALTVPEAQFEPTRELLFEAGLEVRAGKHPVLVARTMYVTDPDGNEVELISPDSAV